MILPGKVYIPLICKARQQGEGMNGFTETTEKRPLTGRKYRIRSVAAAAGCCLLMSLTACGGVAPLTSYERGMAALQSGDLSVAMEHFSASSQTGGEEAMGFRGMGLIHMSRQEYAEAITAFQNSLEHVKYEKLNAAFIEDVQMYLANAYVKNQQPDKAITIYSQLLNSSHAADAYLLRGKLYAAEKKFGQAGQDFERAIELNPSFEVYLQIYDIYVNLNRKADGAAYLKEARGRTTDSVEDAYQMGRICYLLGDYDAAKEQLSRAVGGNISGAAALLGRVYMDQGDFVSARGVFQNCVESGRDISAGYNGLARCAIESGDYDDALRQIHAGLQGADPTVSEELLYNEIVVYERQYDFVTALSKMESFISTYPGNTAARREYTFLKGRVQEINSSPEDISQDVWDQIIREWEEEEAAAAAAGTEEVPEEEYTETYETEPEWIYDEKTGEWYDPEELEGVYYGAYTEENY